MKMKKIIFLILLFWLGLTVLLLEDIRKKIFFEINKKNTSFFL
jgi:hypothetical protein